MSQESITSCILVNERCFQFVAFQVVTSDQYVTGQGTFDQKEFVWTLHKSKKERDTSS